MFDYECPHCEKELSGDFGDDVYCDKCKITMETEWDYIGDGMSAWLTGIEHKD